MALLTKASDNAIVLGSAFFTAFVGIFDTENDRIGFAESINTLPGALLTCSKGDCAAAVGPNSGTDSDSAQIPAGETSWILLVVLLVAATLIIFLFVCWYRRKKSRGGESPEVHESSQR